MKLLSLIAILLFAVNVVAAKNESPDDKIEMCKQLAVDTAKALDSLTGRNDAQSELSTVIEKVYSESDESIYLIATYNFGMSGESYLSVELKPNYYEDGKCVFKSAQVVSQD